MRSVRLPDFRLRAKPKKFRQPESAAALPAQRLFARPKSFFAFHYLWSLNVIGIDDGEPLIAKRIKIILQTCPQVARISSVNLACGRYRDYINKI
jgi:hypothetical protein